jgi:DNA-directed RNA polymerase specialized sigma24 family protein
MATVFILREIDGLSCEEICDTLNVSKSNLWVLLHGSLAAAAG